MDQTTQREWPEPARSTTFILPDLPWAVLLPVIAKDARPGDVIEVHTEAMREVAEAALRAAGRQDVAVELRPPRTRSTGRAA